MVHLSNDHEDRPNQHDENSLSYAICHEMGHPVLILLESQWKLRQQHDQNFPMDGKSYCRTNTSVRRKKEIQNF